MNDLTVSLRGRDTVLRPWQTAVFGRDRDCDICVDPDDLGLSRRSGELRHDPHGWQVVNLSTKLALHLASEDGTVRPLPPASPLTDPVSWPLLGESLNLHLVGEDRVHSMGLRPAQPSRTASRRFGRLPTLTTEQRRIVAALGTGYLRAWPEYDPRPRSLRDTAAALGIPESRVADETRRLWRALTRAGIPDRPGADPVRLITEWLIALDRVTLADLLSLPPQPAQRPQPTTQATPELGGAEPAAYPLHDEVIRIAEAPARYVRPRLSGRLAAVHGTQWPRVIRPDGRPASLDDFRQCLALLGFDSATVGWAAPSVRDDARRLNGLANRAAHRGRLSSEDVLCARTLGARIRENF